MLALRARCGRDARGPSKQLELFERSYLVAPPASFAL
jgi:hypothetical protein